MSSEQHVLIQWSHGVMVSTLDSESSDPSSSLGGTYVILCYSVKQSLSKIDLQFKNVFETVQLKLVLVI